MGEIMPTPAGKQFRTLINGAGIDESTIQYATVFETALDDHDRYFCKKTHKDADLSASPFTRGKYCKAKYYDEVKALQAEVKELAPNIIIALDPIATWALTGSAAFNDLRGTVVLIDGQKIIPTHSPEIMMRQWNLRPVIMSDLAKAERESHSKDHSFKTREIWIEPTLDDIKVFLRNHLTESTLHSIDIETAHGLITMIGFASDDGHALVVPFIDKRKPNFLYWDTPQEELAAWNLVAQICAMANPIVGQNFDYDIQWTYTLMGIKMKNFSQDTMLMHHALQPEMKKGLGFLGSVYTNSPAWKDMRTKGTEQKADE